MFYAYVIKSRDYNYFYKGHCSDLQVRLDQHNAGITKSNKRYLPFEIVYFEMFSTLNEAIAREKYFKTAAGRRFLKTKLNLLKN